MSKSGFTSHLLPGVTITTERTIRGPDLAAFWRIQRARFTAWRAEGSMPPPDDREGKGPSATHLYYHSTIDACHRRTLVTPNRDFPLVAELLALEAETGLPSLLTIEEAAERLGKSIATTQDLAQSGDLLATKMVGRHFWRVPVPAVVTLAARLRGDGALSAVQAAKIMGTNPRLIQQISLGAGAVLARADVPRESHEAFVTEESLMALIGELVINATAEEWRAMRVRFNYEELLTPQQIRVRYHTHLRKIAEAVANGELPCLRTVGGSQRQHSRIPVHAVEQWMAAYRRLPMETLARMLPLPMDALHAHVEAKAFCRLSHQRKTCPRRSCIVNFINQNRTSDGFTGEEWLVWCLQDKAVPVLGEELINTTVGMSRPELDAVLASGQIRGVRLPGGEAAVVRADAMSYRRLRERQLGADDYHLR